MKDTRTTSLLHFYKSSQLFRIPATFSFLIEKEKKEDLFVDKIFKDDT